MNSMVLRIGELHWLSLFFSIETWYGNAPSPDPVRVVVGYVNTESCLVSMPRRWSANDMTESCLTRMWRRGVVGGSANDTTLSWLDNELFCLLMKPRRLDSMYEIESDCRDTRLSCCLSSIWRDKELSCLAITFLKFGLPLLVLLS